METNSYEYQIGNEFEEALDLLLKLDKKWTELGRSSEAFMAALYVHGHCKAYFDYILDKKVNAHEIYKDVFKDSLEIASKIISSGTEAKNDL